MGLEKLFLEDTNSYKLLRNGKIIEEEIILKNGFLLDFVILTQSLRLRINKYTKNHKYDHLAKVL